MISRGDTIHILTVRAPTPRVRWREGSLRSGLERAEYQCSPCQDTPILFRAVSAVRSHNLIPGLRDKGWLIPIERGKCLVVPRAARQDSHEHPFVVAASLALTDHYVSLWSALSFHHLTERLPRMVHAVP